jgi:hypothetical protein
MEALAADMFGKAVQMSRRRARYWNETLGLILIETHTKV